MPVAKQFVGKEAPSIRGALNWNPRFTFRPNIKTKSQLGNERFMEEHGRRRPRSNIKNYTSFTKSFGVSSLVSQLTGGACQQQAGDRQGGHLRAELSV